MIFGKGDRVLTPGGEGDIIFRRMKPPRKVEVQSYCVKLYSKAKNPVYSGTIYPAKDVKSTNEE
jgi:hypothetical protein